MTIWVESKPKRRVPPSVELALGQAALAKRPDNARLSGRVGSLLEKMGRNAEARAALEASLRAAPETYIEWTELARALARLGEGEAALAMCERGAAVAPSAGLARTYGDLLRRRGRLSEAQAAYEAAIAQPEQNLSALNSLLQLIVADSAQACLDRIDALRADYRQTSVARAWRAVALSECGRRDEALAILNPAAHVIAIPFEPPAEFGGIAAFNDVLAAEILADPPGIPFRDDTLVNDRPRRDDKPALRALHDFGRVALADFVGDHARRGLADAPPPPVATLEAITSVVFGQGSNQQHIHETSYATAVYHVRVPAAVRDSEGHHGALELGGCDRIVAGCDPCWERMYRKPIEGWMVLFPSHMFHNVVPTGVPDLRISTAMELTAAPPE